MSYDHNAEELDLYAWNTGELYPSRKAIIAQMKQWIAHGTYTETRARHAWWAWYTTAARRYAREIDSEVRFSRAVIAKVAKERAKIEHDKIKRGEYD